jgi:probable rRNA maturation factor
MGEPGPTDVLSFPMDEDGLIGDVVVCPVVAAANNPDAEGELRLLVAHGVLHLLGYDHEEEEDRRVMWERQERYAWGEP